MTDTETVKQAKTALDAAEENLRNPQAGNVEAAAVCALIGIGRGLLAVQEEIRRRS